ncbi:MAG: hypothetical protein HY244_12725 [Rhizobiales bacterium]|nr:hypothetical protein [Hyphomicrobiales bacterium]
MQAIAQAQTQSLNRARSQHTPAQRRAIASGARHSAFATAPERRLASIGAMLNSGAIPVAQLVIAYEHNWKLYYNDESMEPPPQGYTQVDAKTFNGGEGAAWTLSPPTSSADYNYILKEMVDAAEKNDFDRVRQLESFIDNTLSKEEASFFVLQFERILGQRQMAREAPDDTDYYLSYLDMEDPSPSDYAMGLMVKGIPGAGKLMEQYDTSSGGAKVGFEKQLEVTRKIEEERGLRAVEQNQSDITSQNVFVSADIVTSDKEGKDVLVEVKYWPGLESWDPPKQKQMVGQLIDQLTRYARTGKKVELHWLAALPDWLGMLLNEVTSRTQGQIKIITG